MMISVLWFECENGTPPSRQACTVVHSLEINSSEAGIGQQNTKVLREPQVEKEKN